MAPRLIQTSCKTWEPTFLGGPSISRYFLVHFVFHKSSYPATNPTLCHCLGSKPSSATPPEDLERKTSIHRNRVWWCLYDCYTVYDPVISDRGPPPMVWGGRYSIHHIHYIHYIHYHKPPPPHHRGEGSIYDIYVAYTVYTIYTIYTLNTTYMHHIHHIHYIHSTVVYYTDPSP